MKHQPGRTYHNACFRATSRAMPWMPTGVVGKRPQAWLLISSVGRGAALRASQARYLFPHLSTVLFCPLYGWSCSETGLPDRLTQQVLGQANPGGLNCPVIRHEGAIRKERHATVLDDVYHRLCTPATSSAICRLLSPVPSALENATR